LQLSGEGTAVGKFSDHVCFHVIHCSFVFHFDIVCDTKEEEQKEDRKIFNNNVRLGDHKKK
jgi:hypothetical protein